MADGECIRLQRQRPSGKASIAVLAFVEPSESTMVGLNDELATKKIDSKGFKGELDGETFFLDGGVATLTRLKLSAKNIVYIANKLLSR